MTILTNNENPVIRGVRALIIGAVSVGITAIVNAIANGDLSVPGDAAWIVPLLTSALLGLDKWLRGLRAAA